MAPLSLRSVGTWFNHCTLQCHKLKYKDTFVLSAWALWRLELHESPFESLISQMLLKWAAKWTPCEIPHTLAWLCCFYFWHLFCILYFLMDISEAIIPPPKIFQKWSCKVPPPPIHATSCWHLMHSLWKNIQQFVLGRKLRCCFMLIKWVKEKWSVVYFN